ncbi:MAG: molybdopterin-binding protein [Verrucomicrobiota bacterium]
MKIGRVTISDRASVGTYEDRSGPEIENVLRELFGDDLEFFSDIIPDEADLIAAALKRFADELHCDLIITTGGTGIAVLATNVLTWLWGV